MLRRILFLLTIFLFLVSFVACSKGAETPPAPTETSSQTEEGAVAETSEPLPNTAFASGPSMSSPIAVTENDVFVLAVNPLNDSVSIFAVEGDANIKLTEIPTGDHPQTVATSPDSSRAYVANQFSNNVSVIDLEQRVKIADIAVGAGPYGIALTPDGGRAYVANSAANTVSVIDTATNSVLATISIPGIRPHGVAITNNNAGAGPEFVYVTQFFSQPSPSGGPGLDKGSEGKVFVLSTADDSQIQGVITLSAHETGFTADRTKFGETEAEPTFAFPNQLQAIALKNGRGYLPNIAASPEGPVKFNVNTQAFLSVFDIAAKIELRGGTINIHSAVKSQTFTPKLFFANPWAIAFKHNANEGYVVSAGADAIVKITLDAGGIPSVVLDTTTEGTTRVRFVEVGLNPRGIAVNHSDTRAFVLNYISKDVTVIDISGDQEAVLATMQSTDLPAPGSDGAKFLAGNYLFNTSRGAFDEGVTERMSSEGWQSCASCHPDGLTDGIIWQFASGPRKTIPLNGSFSPASPETNQRVFNYSGVFDEIEDFELNIRGVSGGPGLIVNPGSTDPDTNIKAFDPPNTGREQLHFAGFPAWDAITAWVKFRIDSPPSPLTDIDPASETARQMIVGRELFTAANCQACHGGPKWSTSQVDFPRVSPFPETLTPGENGEPPLAQLARFLKDVGTFTSGAPQEKTAANQDALGRLGFNPPSLLSIWAFPPYLHNGACATLDCVLENETHRNAGGTDVLDNPADRQTLVTFLRSIDITTSPIAP